MGGVFEQFGVCGRGCCGRFNGRRGICRAGRGAAAGGGSPHHGSSTHLPEQQPDARSERQRRGGWNGALWQCRAAGLAATCAAPAPAPAGLCCTGNRSCRRRTAFSSSSSRAAARPCQPGLFAACQAAWVLPTSKRLLPLWCPAPPALWQSLWQTLWQRWCVPRSCTWTRASQQCATANPVRTSAKTRKLLPLCSTLTARY